MGRVKACGREDAELSRSQISHLIDEWIFSELVHKLRELMYSAPDDRTRQEFQGFVSRIESMA